MSRLEDVIETVVLLQHIRKADCFGLFFPPLNLN